MVAMSVKEMLSMIAAFGYDIDSDYVRRLRDEVARYGHIVYQPCLLLLLRGRLKRMSAIPVMLVEQVGVVMLGEQIPKTR